MPFRELQQPPVQGTDGHYYQPPIAYYYQIKLMETIFRTHCPTWDDIIQLLVSLFSTEDRHRVLTEARKWLREMVPEGVANLERWIDQKMFVDHEQFDGYKIDRCVYDEAIDTYDTMNLIVEYTNGVLMSYSESSAAMYEGFKLYINGSDARLEVQSF